jgi:hypothetical protein
MSPIAGRMAWSGTSAGGYLDTVVNLPGAANGQNVQFRWRMASDSSVTATGVNIDDVQIVSSFNCAALISGTVTYSNAIGNPPAPRFVSNVQMTGVGSPPVIAITAFPSGTYSLTGFGAGSYTPTKTGGVNGSISSFDAARIAQHSAGPPNPQLTGNQLVVADVSNSGTVSSFDAGMIAKFVAGPPYTAPGIGATASWRFNPTNRVYASVVSSVTAQDYGALLMGEVTGNWTDNGTRPANGIERSTAVAAPSLVASANKEVVIPVTVEGVANKDVIAYEFDLRYDPSVIQPQGDPVDLVGTASRGLTAVTNVIEPGLLRVVVYGPTPISENGLLLNLRFTAVGTPGSVSPLTWERIMFNEDADGTMVTDGSVVLSQN